MPESKKTTERKPAAATKTAKKTDAKKAATAKTSTAAKSTAPLAVTKAAAPPPTAAPPQRPATGEVCPRCGTSKFGPEQRIRAEGDRTVRYTVLVCERGHTFAKPARRTV